MAVKKLIYAAPNSKAYMFLSESFIRFAQSIGARQLIENEDVVGATGDAPTTSDGSTMSLPTKVLLISEVGG